MLVRLRVPKTIQWVVNLFLIFMLIFTLFRLSTLIAFKPGNISPWQLWPSFLLGFRYDARWISLLLLPIALFSILPPLSPYFSSRNKKWWTWYLALGTLFIFFFFGADFGHFSYVSTRLNASALNFMEDAKISFRMLWQSYPLIWILIGLVVAVGFFAWLFRKTHWQVIERTDGLGIRHRRRWFMGTALLLGFLAYGRVGWPPLKWEEAFQLNDNFKSYLALNPLQNFFTTLKFRRPLYDEGKTRACFNLLAGHLQIDTSRGFGYSRRVEATSRALPVRPNVVLVICESFSMYKSSMSGNPLNTTPYFKAMCDSGVFFNRCFSPHFGTARGVFALLTGIPDVQLSKFSSRNPEALKQHTIINQFEGYEPYYFIGGSTEFNNFRGLLKNINGLHLYEEGDYQSPPVNVWGISDKDLFQEANMVLKKETKPFFAIIQTADNHRPYTIPAADREFKKRNPHPDTLRKYGFGSPEEMNAFAYMDYSIQQFMQAAAAEPYFRNTVFVFIGDHGVAGEAGALYPRAWTEQRLSDEHVPLLFYAPGLLQPKTYTHTVSQIDVLPTIAGLAGIPYTNTTLGRDLFNDNLHHEAFIIHHDEGKIGIVNDSVYFISNIRFRQDQLFPANGNTLNYSPEEQASLKARLSQLAHAYFETGRWMLVNNKN